MRKSPQGERGRAGIVGITAVDVRYLSFGEVIRIAVPLYRAGREKKREQDEKERGEEVGRFSPPWQTQKGCL
jgi:hypothetical protein